MSANPNLKLNVLNDSGTQIFFVNQTTGVNSTLISTYTNTTTSTNSSSASFVLSGGLSVANTTNASSSTAGGAVTIAGGLAVGNDSYIGGTIYTPRVSSGSIATPGITAGTVYVSSITSGTIQVSGNTSIGNVLSVAGLVQFNSTAISTNSSTGSAVLQGGLSINRNTNSSSYTQGGALTVVGGASIAQDTYVGGTIFTPRISSGSMATPGLTVGTVYVNSITSGSIQVSGDVTIGGSLTVLGSTTVLNVTTANQIETNVTSSNIFLLGTLIAGGNSHTLGNIFTTGGNVGIGTTSPGARLDVSGTARITTSLTTGALFSTNQTTTNIVGTNISTSSLQLSGNLYSSSINIPNTVNNFSGTSGAVNLLGDTVISGNELMFTNSGVNAPTMNGRSNGTKIVLFPSTNTTQGDYSMGIENRNMWFQVATNQDGYKFYQGTSANLVLFSSGNVGIGTTSPLATLQIGNSVNTYNNTSCVIYGNDVNNANIPFIIQSDFRVAGSNNTRGILSRFEVRNTSGVSYFNDVCLNNAGLFQITVSGNTGLGLDQSGQLGIGTLSPNFKLDVSGTARITTSITTGVLFSTSQTTTNAVFTNLSSGTISLTTLSTANVYSSLGTFSNLVGVNLSSSNLISTVATIPNIIHTNITSTSIMVTGGGLSATFNSNTIGNIFTTGGNVGIGTSTPGSLLDIQNSNTRVQIIPDSINTVMLINSSTSGSAIMRWGTSSDIRVEMRYTASANSYSLLKYTNFFNDAVNLIECNDTNSLIQLGRGSGIVGNAIVSIPGNVGIGTTSPGTTLDVTGTARFTTSVTTAALYSTNQTTTNAVFTNLSAGTIRLTTLTSANVYSSLGTFSNLVGVNLSSSNLIATVSTIPNIIHTNITSTSMMVTGGGLLATFNSNTIGNIFTTGGNVGIGTSSPGSSLDVRGPGNWGHVRIIPSVSGSESALGFMSNADGSTGTSSTSANWLIGINLVGYAQGQFNIRSRALASSPSGADAIFTIDTNGNIGIGTTSPNTKLEVAGTIRATTSVTTGSLFSTNQTTTNAVLTNVTTTNLVGANNTLTNLNLTSQTTTNALFTNISTTSLNSATGIFSTGITSGIGWFTNSLTAGNFFANNITISSIFATTMTLGTLLMTTLVSTPNLTLTNLTATNALVTNASISSSRVTNEIATNISASTLNAGGLTAGNINFTGSLYQNGSLYISSQWTTFGTNLAYTTGNVGINTTSPTFALDVNGNGRFRNTAFSTNSTSGALVMAGGVSITGTNAASNTMGGGLTVAGGIGVSQDLYVGGNVYFKGIDATVITGTQSIGSNTNTGTYQTSVTLPRTMANTSYKIVGSLKSTSNNTNVYSVSFTNVTTSGFTANIYRLDALGSGWTDTNLVLSYVVYP